MNVSRGWSSVSKMDLCLHLAPHAIIDNLIREKHKA